MEKLNTTIKFCIFELVLVPNFSLNRQFWFFRPNLNKKSFSGQKWKNWTPPLRVLHVWILYLVWEPNIILSRQFWFFWPNLLKKGYFRSKTKKVNITNWILHVQISIADNFDFLNQICRKTEKVNATSEFSILELV